jgi:hypothetical protein
MLLHQIARNYLANLAPFPGKLTPEMLPVPGDEQEQVFFGLECLHTVMNELYASYLDVEGDYARLWKDAFYCWKLVEGAPVVLWALGAAGQVVGGPEGSMLWVPKEHLRNALELRKIPNHAWAVSVLERAGFSFYYYGDDNLPCQGGYNHCATVEVGYPRRPDWNDALLKALTLYARTYQFRKGVGEFEVIARLEMRPFLPGYDPTGPIDYTQEDLFCAIPAGPTRLWQETCAHITAIEPANLPFFHLPVVRRARWQADFARSRKGRIFCGLYVEGENFWVRIPFTPEAYQAWLRDNPGWQENTPGSLLKKRRGRTVYTRSLEEVDLADVMRLLDLQAKNF